MCRWASGTFGLEIRQGQQRRSHGDASLRQPPDGAAGLGAPEPSCGVQRGLVSVNDGATRRRHLPNLRDGALGASPAHPPRRSDAPTKSPGRSRPPVPAWWRRWAEPRGTSGLKRRLDFEMAANSGRRHYARPC
eukprot:scaffold5558_cov241-Pinguiococcus_pyrenoidosus.AAC.2